MNRFIDLPAMLAKAEADLCRLLRWHVGYHLVSAAIGASSLALIAVLTLIWGPSGLLAAGLACFFFGVFAYFCIGFYLHEKRKAQLARLAHSWQKRLKPADRGDESQCFQALSHQLHEVEFRLFAAPSRLGGLAISEQFAGWWVGEDVRALREWLLLVAARQSLREIRASPLDSTSHQQLASICIFLADLWLKPTEPAGALRALRPASDERAAAFLRLALEELHLVLETAQPTAETHLLIANCHQRLDERERQAESLAALLALDPAREEVRFQLGQLYFALGRQRQGLEMYTHFERLGDPRAAALLAHYGAQRLLSLSVPLDETWDV